MNQRLQAINAVYIELQEYIDPLPGTIEYLDESQLTIFLQQFDMARTQYHSILREFVELLPQLTPKELAESYSSACRLLQRGIGGYMARHFDSLYLPVMIQSVKVEELHVVEMFLQVLMEYAPKEAIPLVLQSLDSDFPFIREAAIYLARKYHLDIALPKIKQIANNNSDDNSLLAQRIVKDWSVQ